MEALVIGGTGPTGPHVVEGLLRRGYRVTVLHSGRHEVPLPDCVPHIHADVHFRETLVAALGDRTFDLVVAMYGRLKLTADVMAGRTPRLVSIGGGQAATLEPTVWGAGGRCISAPPPWLGRPRRAWDHFYAMMHEAEQAVMAHHAAGDYVATHLRFPPIYGPRQLADTDWSIVRRILDGRRQFIIADHGLKLETRAYAENAAHATLLAVDRPAASAGRVYNVGDAQVLTMFERVALIAAALDHRWEVVSLPYELAKPFHPVGRGRTHQVLDCRPIADELGYRDVVPAEEAVPAAARWLAAHPPERGGELERQLNDPFDYAGESAMIAAWTHAKQAMQAVPFPDYVVAHPYRHPTRPDEPWQPPSRPVGSRAKSGDS
ncbi:MAG: NAD-dependent epimerase/dehydratase family protein [Alphaproteobacteria bacterium]|nr:NAD-dependent epimerase/dehydratase family protein [Alphaproteobacteria bacterium]